MHFKAWLLFCAPGQRVCVQVPQWYPFPLLVIVLGMSVSYCVSVSPAVFYVIFLYLVQKVLIQSTVLSPDKWIARVCRCWFVVKVREEVGSSSLYMPSSQKSRNFAVFVQILSFLSKGWLNWPIYFTTPDPEKYWEVIFREDEMVVIAYQV